MLAVWCFILLLPHCITLTICQNQEWGRVSLLLNYKMRGYPVLRDGGPGRHLQRWRMPSCLKKEHSFLINDLLGPPRFFGEWTADREAGLKDEWDWETVSALEQAGWPLAMWSWRSGTKDWGGWSILFVWAGWFALLNKKRWPFMMWRSGRTSMIIMRKQPDWAILRQAQQSRPKNVAMHCDRGTQPSSVGWSA